MFSAGSFYLSMFWICHSFPSSPWSFCWETLIRAFSKVTFPTLTAFTWFFYHWLLTMVVGCDLEKVFLCWGSMLSSELPTLGAAFSSPGCGISRLLGLSTCSSPPSPLFSRTALMLGFLMEPGSLKRTSHFLKNHFFFLLFHQIHFYASTLTLANSLFVTIRSFSHALQCNYSAT